jgi:hypothetical protein
MNNARYYPIGVISSDRRESRNLSSESRLQLQAEIPRLASLARNDEVE